MNVTGGNGRKGLGRGSTAQFGKVPRAATVPAVATTNNEKKGLKAKPRTSKPHSKFESLFSRLKRRANTNSNSASFDAKNLTMSPPTYPSPQHQEKEDPDDSSEDEVEVSPVARRSIPIRAPHTRDAEANKVPISSSSSLIAASSSLQDSPIAKARQLEQDTPLQVVAPTNAAATATTTTINTTTSTLKNRKRASVTVETDWMALLWPQEKAFGGTESSTDSPLVGKQLRVAEALPVASAKPEPHNQAETLLSRVYNLEKRVDALEGRC